MTPPFRIGRSGFLPVFAGSLSLALLAGAAPPPAGPGDVEGMRQAVDAAFVAGPTVARDLNARVAWQARVPIADGSKLAAIETIGDAVLAIDTRNQICRLRPEDGSVVWRAAVGNPVDRFLGIFAVDAPAAEGKFYAVFSTELWVLEASSGSILSRQPLAKLPVTRPLVVGPIFVYGTAAGHIVAHHCLVGHEWRANSLKGRIAGAPLPVGDRFVVASAGGDVACLNAEGINRYWDTNLYAGVQAAPAVCEGAVFVAGLDQYLWAFDIRSGTPIWRKFFERPLVDSPIASGDAILQRVPDLGVVCFAARPDGKPDGEIRWTAPAVGGTHVGEIDGQVAFWDDAARTLVLLDPRQGQVTRRVELPQAAGVLEIPSGDLAGNVFVFAADGRVVRLVPRGAKAP